MRALEHCGHHRAALLVIGFAVLAEEVMGFFAMRREKFAAFFTFHRATNLANSGFVASEMATLLNAGGPVGD